MSRRLWKPPYNYFLLPFSGVYWLGLQAWYLYDSLRKRKKFEAFTIVVGNLTVGGTGKSPLVYLLAKYLSKEFNVAVISRGYGRKKHDVIVLEPDADLPDVSETGDEPFLNFIKLARKVPFVICKDRIKAYEVAEEKFHPDVVILDDAYQYRKIVPDFSFLVFDKRVLSSRGFLLPAGPFREPINAGKKADIIAFNLKSRIMNGDELWQLKRIFPDKTFILFKYRPEGLLDKCRFLEFTEVTKDIIAFAGIGDPESFLVTLDEVGFNVVKFFEFPDHHWYTSDEINKLKSHGYPLITTEKDYVRIKEKEGILALVIEPELIDGMGIIEDLKERIRKRGNI